MQDSDPSADQGADCPVKSGQHRWRAIAGALSITIKQDLADAGCAQPLAFHGEKREFVDRIVVPEFGTKLETIDDPRRRSETNVLRAEIAMPFDDPAHLDALHQQVGTANEGFDPSREVLAHQPQNGTARFTQNPTARSAFLTKAVEIGFRPDIRMPGRGKEFRKTGGERLNIGRAPSAAREAAVEHAVGGQADHLDQPIDDGPFSGEREAVPAKGQWHDAEIDFRRETSVETHLLFGVPVPQRRGRKIQPVTGQRLFQLEDVFLGQKHPGKIRFNPFDLQGAPSISCWRAEKRNLAVDIYLRRSRARRPNRRRHPSRPERRSRSAASWRSASLIPTG
jgi:hypothetical protein